MHVDQICNSSESVSAHDVKAFFAANDVSGFPENYGSLLVKHNGGTIHPSVSESDEDVLIELFPISSDKFIESVEKVVFDREESSIPDTLNPIFRIGRSWDSHLYLSLADNLETFFMYSLSYDEFKPINSTLTQFLGSLTCNEARAELLEADQFSGSPWNQVRVGNYEAILNCIDQKELDVNSACSDDPMKRTLLMLALQGCRLALANELVDRKADWGAIDAKKTPAIFYSRGFLEGLILAEESGCDLNVLDSKGDNLLHLIARESESNVSYDLRCFDWLCSRVNRDARNIAGDSPKDLLDRQVKQFRLQNADHADMDDSIPFSLAASLRSLQN